MSSDKNSKEMLTRVEADRSIREKHVCEVKTSGKLKNVKCYIQEVNNNTQTKIEDVKTVYIARNEDSKQPNVMMRERNKEFGFPNPFLPGGQVSEEADLIVRLWTEGRLAEFFNKVNESSDESETIEIEQRGCKESKKEAKVVFVGADEVDQDKRNGNQKKKKEKFQNLCCTMM